MAKRKSTNRRRAANPRTKSSPGFFASLINPAPGESNMTKYLILAGVGVAAWYVWKTYFAGAGTATGTTQVGAGATGTTTTTPAIGSGAGTTTTTTPTTGTGTGTGTGAGAAGGTSTTASNPPAAQSPATLKQRLGAWAANNNYNLDQWAWGLHNLLGVSDPNPGAFASIFAAQLANRTALMTLDQFWQGGGLQYATVIAPAGTSLGDLAGRNIPSPVRVPASTRSQSWGGAFN